MRAAFPCYGPEDWYWSIMCFGMERSPTKPTMKKIQLPSGNSTESSIRTIASTLAYYQSVMDSPSPVSVDPSILGWLKYSNWILRNNSSPKGLKRSYPNLHKVVSLICTPSTTYPFIISKLQTRPSVRLGVKYTKQAWSRCRSWMLRGRLIRDAYSVLHASSLLISWIEPRTRNFKTPDLNTLLEIFI